MCVYVSVNISVVQSLAARNDKFPSLLHSFYRFPLNAALFPVEVYIFLIRLSIAQVDRYQFHCLKTRVFYSQTTNYNIYSNIYYSDCHFKIDTKNFFLFFFYRTFSHHENADDSLKQPYI